MPHAIVLHRYGPPEALQLEEVPRPALAPDEVRVSMLAAGVNRTDIEIRAGIWPILKDDPFPYIPGIEAIGQVVELGADVSDFAVGDIAITMMMGLGGVRAERAGGYQEEAVVRAANCAKVPADAHAMGIAAFGLAGVTALNGRHIAEAAAGARILVTGAGGGVGSCAIRIGQAFGAEMVAITSDLAKAPSLQELGAAEVVLVPRGGGEIELPEIDGVVDTVGGPIFAALVEALKPGGRLCLVGAAAGEAVAFSAWALLREIVLTGWSSEKLDGPGLRRDIETLARLLRERRLKPPPVTQLLLSEAAAAHRSMDSSAHSGKLLLLPDSARSDPVER